MAKAKLTHVDAKGEARMVRVGDKPVTARRAKARATVAFSVTAFRLLARNALAKGDAWAVARLAGIQAAKRTMEWIPLCHAVPLDHVEVTMRPVARTRRVIVTAQAEARWRTGVEMEALVAVSAAALALYDMVKSVDRSARIVEIVLLEKSGGRSGTWRRGS